MKSTPSNNQIVCHFCNQNGHMKSRCLLERNAYYGMKCIWVPKGITTNSQGSKKL